MNNGRRSFFKTLATLAGGSALMMLLPKSALAEGRAKVGAAATGANLCDPTKGMAAGMNYKHDKKDVKDAKLKIAKGGVPWEKQHCENCSFYNPEGKGDTGKCQVIPEGCLVKAKGWCSSWAEKKKV